MQPIVASQRHARAIRAVADLLQRLRLDFLFVGSVARAAHIGAPVDTGSIDAVVTMGPQQKNQLAMMANNNGFRVDRDELAAAEELDLIPIAFDDVRVHILVASNALYGRMVADGITAPFEHTTLRVPRAEDFALLLQLGTDVDSLMTVIESPSFDRDSYNSKLASIGLGGLVIPG